MDFHKRGMGMKKFKAFSLAEMMVVMLVVSIVLAATAPMITRKVSRERSDKIFDMLNTDPKNAVEYVKGRNQRLFMNSRNNGYIGITETGNTIPKNSVVFGKYKDSQTNENLNTYDSIVGIGFDIRNLGSKSVSIGYGAGSSSEGTAIGYNSFGYGTAVGAKAFADGTHSVALGRYSSAIGNYSIAIGGSANGSGNDGTVAFSENSIAIGRGAQANKTNSVAIGYNAETKYDNTIVLGTEADTVYIPGNLLVGKTVAVGVKGRLDGKRYPFYAYAHYSHDGDGRQFTDITEVVEHNHASDYKGGDDWPVAMIDTATKGIQVGPYKFSGEHFSGADYSDDQKLCPPANSNGNWDRKSNGWCGTVDSSSNNTLLYSDEQLKNVGEPFVSGLDALNKLKIYNYTFKSDTDKTPQVGVIAQDLQKIFPTAVITGDDGYLKIRWDEMFYCAINAIKELDNKFILLSEKVKNITSDLASLKTTVEQQQKTIDSQVKTLQEQQSEIKVLSEKVQKLEARKK
jgi:prepilin-type N-terminal cleavage/methylation domain-containing protein